MENNKLEFNISLQTIIEKPILFSVERINRFNSLKFKTNQKYYSNLLFVEVTNYDCMPSDIFKLGASICSSIINWNDRIKKQINDRSSFNNFTNSPFFLGTDIEKEFLNQEDNKKIINISDTFLNDFINDIKIINFQNKQYIKDKLVFEISLGNSDYIISNVNEYNNEYKTNFEVIKIEHIDQLFFATIEVSEIDLLDIFCFGFNVQYDEEKRNVVSNQ